MGKSAKSQSHGSQQGGRGDTSPLLPSDVSTLQRMGDELGEFLSSFEVEVDEALAAARAGRPDTFTRVEQILTYLLERYIGELGERSRPPAVTKQPTGLPVGSGLMAALTYLDARECSDCLSSLQAAVKALPARDAEPVGRKPIFLGTDAERRAMRREAEAQVTADRERVSALIAAVEEPLCRVLELLRGLLTRVVRVLTDRTPAGGSTRGASRPAEKRSYTQGQMDNAIREYKARRASNYDELVKRVEAGAKGAKKAAQEMFGRNAIANALGARAPAMVTKSPVWHEIARELQLPSKVTSGHGASRQVKMGLDMALERQADTQEDEVVIRAIRNEMCDRIRSTLGADEAEATIEKYRRGDMTEEDVEEMLTLFGSGENGK